MTTFNSPLISKPIADDDDDGALAPVEETPAGAREYHAGEDHYEEDDNSKSAPLSDSFGVG